MAWIRVVAGDSEKSVQFSDIFFEVETMELDRKENWGKELLRIKDHRMY